MESSEPPAVVAVRRIRFHQELVLVALGIALNVGIGVLVHAAKLPIYLDTIGTIVVTLVAGWRAGIIAGVLSSLLNGLVTDPLLPAFAAGQVAVAVYVHLVGRQGWFATVPKTILSGLGLGIVTAIVSAPVAAYLFGGITGYGASGMSEFLLKTGQRAFDSVVLSGLASDPVDKTIASVLAVLFLHALPGQLRPRFYSGSLIQRTQAKD